MGMLILPTYLFTYLVQLTYLDIDLNLFWTNLIDIPNGKFLLHHVSQSKTIQTQKLNFLNYFKIIIETFDIIKSWDMWQNIICFHCSPK
jgi:hypothetical protein